VSPRGEKGMEKQGHPSFQEEKEKEEKGTSIFSSSRRMHAHLYGCL
jgi:hypothetical protein